MLKKIAGLVCLLLILPGISQSQEVSKNQTASAAVEEETSPVSIGFSTSISSSLHKSSDQDHSLSADLSVDPTVDMGDGYYLFGSVSGLKDLKGERKWYWNDGVIGLSKGLAKFEHISIGSTTMAILPFSEQSKDYRHLRVGFQFAPSFSLSFNKLGLPGFKIKYSPSARVNFHEFTTSLTGGSNTQYRLANKLSLSYGITDSVRISASGSYGRSYTYKGNTKDSYSISQNIGFSPTANTEINLGHAIGGSPLAPNGTDTDVDLFNNRDSSVYAGFGVTY